MDMRGVGPNQASGGSTPSAMTMIVGRSLSCAGLTSNGEELACHMVPREHDLHSISQSDAKRRGHVGVPHTYEEEARNHPRLAADKRGASRIWLYKGDARISHDVVWEA
jgi:hypothetical protein